MLSVTIELFCFSSYRTTSKYQSIDRNILYNSRLPIKGRPAIILSYIMSILYIKNILEIGPNRYVYFPSPSPSSSFHLHNHHVLIPSRPEDWTFMLKNRFESNL